MPAPDAGTLAALAGLVPALLDRDQDALVFCDPASGAWWLADSVFGRWSGLAGGAVSAEAVTAWLGEAAAAVRVAERAALAAGGPQTAEQRVEWQGRRYEFSVLRQAVPGPQGQAWVAAVWRDLGPRRRRDEQLRLAIEQLEQQQQANERLRKELQGQSPRDSATGLYNRAHFEDQLRREVDLSSREHREFALVAIEIDPLAEDIVVLGATAQQRIAESMGRLLRGNTRAMDASCRDDDGRRFAVLLSGVGLATAHSRMEGLRRQCATQIVALDGREIGFTVSMGVASFPHTAQTQDEIRAACEAALSDARARGGNRVALASIRFDAG